MSQRKDIRRSKHRPGRRQAVFARLSKVRIAEIFVAILLALFAMAALVAIGLGVWLLWRSDPSLLLVLAAAAAVVLLAVKTWLVLRRFSTSEGALARWRDWFKHHPLATSVIGSVIGGVLMLAVDAYRGDESRLEPRQPVITSSATPESAEPGTEVVEGEDGGPKKGGGRQQRRPRPTLAGRLTPDEEELDRIVLAWMPLDKGEPREPIEGADAGALAFCPGGSVATGRAVKKSERLFQDSSGNAYLVEVKRLVSETAAKDRVQRIEESETSCEGVQIDSVKRGRDSEELRISLPGQSRAVTVYRIRNILIRLEVQTVNGPPAVEETDPGRSTYRAAAKILLDTQAGPATSDD